jgi:hypothetical protein
MGRTDAITKGRIAGAYLDLAAGPGEFVSIRALRERLAGVEGLDAILIAMYAAQEINLIPESAQQSLSEADRRAAVRCGGEDKHWMSWED